MAQAETVDRRRARRTQEAPSEPLSEAIDITTPTETAVKAPRRRGSRGGRRHRKPGATSEQSAVEATPEATVVETPQAPSRRRNRRSHGKPATVETQPEPQSVVAEPKPKRSRSRKPKPAEATATVAAVEAKPKRSRKRNAQPEPQEAYDDTAPQPTISPRKARVPVTGAPTDVPAPFAHNAEYEFARILDFYGIEWRYEPRLFPLRWERGHVTEAFTPDFYLPDLDLFVDLTTLKSGLTAEKNRKMRIVQELYPDVNIIMLKKRDYLRLLQKYGYGAISPDQVPEIDKVLITATKLQQRVQELGEQISKDYAGREPILVGVLRGVMCFIADLMRQVSLPTSVDFMSISSYDGNGAAAVRILKDLDLSIKGRDVILVEDIVDTGMTLNHMIAYLKTKKPASIKVCTLLDKRARRLIEVPVEYVGFEVPDEFVVGYGLDFNQRFRNLPFIGTLKHELLP